MPKNPHIKYQPSQDNYEWLLRKQTDKWLKNGRRDGLGRLVDQLISQLRKQDSLFNE